MFFLHIYEANHPIAGQSARPDQSRMRGVHHRARRRKARHGRTVTAQKRSVPEGAGDEQVARAERGVVGIGQASEGRTMSTKSPLHVFGLGLGYLGLGVTWLVIRIAPAGPARDKAIRTSRQLRARIMMASR
jgi:hypothetical protein